MICAHSDLASYSFLRHDLEPDNKVIAPKKFQFIKLKNVEAWIFNKNMARMVYVKIYCTRSNMFFKIIFVFINVREINPNSIHKLK